MSESQWINYLLQTFTHLFCRLHEIFDSFKNIENQAKQANCFIVHSNKTEVGGGSGQKLTFKIFVGSVVVVEKFLLTV